MVEDYFKLMGFSSTEWPAGRCWKSTQEAGRRGWWCSSSWRGECGCCSSCRVFFSFFFLNHQLTCCLRFLLTLLGPVSTALIWPFTTLRCLPVLYCNHLTCFCVLGESFWSLFSLTLALEMEKNFFIFSEVSHTWRNVFPLGIRQISTSCRISVRSLQTDFGGSSLG